MAKFKVGDKVKYTGRTGKTVTATIEGALMEPGYFIIKTPDGVKLPMPEKLLTAANSRACNAKFKVGDKVKFKADGKDLVGTITRCYASSSHEMYDVKVGSETLTVADTPMKLANSAASANPTVANAINAMARK